MKLPSRIRSDDRRAYFRTTTTILGRIKKYLATNFTRLRSGIRNTLHEKLTERRDRTGRGSKGASAFGPTVAPGGMRRARAQAGLDSQATVVRVNWDRVALVAAGFMLAIAITAQFIMRGEQQGRKAHSADVIGLPPQLILEPSAADTLLGSPTIANATLTTAPGEVPLGVSVRGADGAALEIGGLQSGFALSVGRPFGTGGWRMMAADAAGAVIRPPPDFVGAITLVVELRLANDTLIDRQVVRRAWGRRADVVTAAAPAPGSAVSAAAGQGTSSTEIRGLTGETNPANSQTSNPSLRLIDFEEIFALRKRGEEMWSKGDVQSARLALRRAAEAGDGPSVLELAETYDPVVLAEHGIRGVSSDVDLARTWYELAKTFGSLEARQRLEALPRRHVPDQ